MYTNTAYTTWPIPRPYLITHPHTHVRHIHANSYLSMYIGEQNALNHTLNCGFLSQMWTDNFTICRRTQPRPKVLPKKVFRPQGSLKFTSSDVVTCPAELFARTNWIVGSYHHHLFTTLPSC